MATKLDRTDNNSFNSAIKVAKLSQEVLQRRKKIMQTLAKISHLLSKEKWLEDACAKTEVACKEIFKERIH